MRLWRLSSARHAQNFNGGYGLSNHGRWNTAGRPVTYCAISASLAALEKRVHVIDPALLPTLTMIEYAAPDDLPSRVIDVAMLPADWISREVDTQALGDRWLDAVTATLLFVPSVILPLPSAPERNVLINHRHARAVDVTLVSSTPFTLDQRLFHP